ncbi:single-stranded DNA-binding protein [Streptomyces sp. NPDC085524]|uniref:single-stranded DNA-binding protein n=1 Tax=unclassified Streptomyces TaxID=2593676 RepID=UPI0035D9AE56
MSGETTITVIGNVVADPELRFTPSGAAVANFRIASTPRKFNKQSDAWEDGEPLFLSVAVWRRQAEHVAESLTRGTRVIVVGVLTQRQYEAGDGTRRSSYEIQAEEVAPSLLRATAAVTKAGGATVQGARQPDRNAGHGYAPPQEDQWAQHDGGFDGRPPF